MIIVTWGKVVVAIEISKTNITNTRVNDLVDVSRDREFISCNANPEAILSNSMEVVDKPDDSFTRVEVKNKLGLLENKIEEEPTTSAQLSAAERENTNENVRIVPQRRRQWNPPLSSIKGW